MNLYTIKKKLTVKKKNRKSGQFHWKVFYYSRLFECFLFLSEKRKYFHLK